MNQFLGNIKFRALYASLLAHCLDHPNYIASIIGRNRAIVIAESLARVIVAIRIASVRWRSYLSPKHRN